MPRIAGINIPQEKQILTSLTYIYGVGRTLSRKILEKTQIEPQKLAKDLTEEEVEMIRKVLESGYKIEGVLRREQSMNIKRLKDIGCYRGIRHIKNLPVRGQRTKTNTRTVKGNVRKTVSSGKKKTAEKT